MLKVRLTLVLGSLVLAAVLGVISTFAWLSTPAPTPAVAQPLAAGVAQVAADAYVSGSSNLPKGLAVAASSSNNAFGTVDPSTWTNLHPLATPAPASFSFSTPAYTNGRLLETHKYIVALGVNPELFDLYVVIDVTDPSHPFLAANPSLVPKNPSQGGAVLDYSQVVGHFGSNDQPAIDDQGPINRWAQAFTQSSAKLDAVVSGKAQGDGASYMTLSGYSVPGNPEILGGYRNSDYDVVHVTLLLTPASANGVTVSSDYDLLVTHTNDPLGARVVAWGPAGSGPTLSPYQNKVS